MSDPYLGEIRMFAGNFAPRGWALCQGQLLAISQYSALFSLLGTLYGGDGRTTFGLPDLRGRVPIHQGHGSGLSNRPIGQKLGSERVALNVNELPVHAHPIAQVVPASLGTPLNNVVAQAETPVYVTESENAATPDAAMNASRGGSQPHHNMAPFLAIHFIIALQGVYPSRS